MNSRNRVNEIIDKDRNLGMFKSTEGVKKKFWNDFLSTSLALYLTPPQTPAQYGELVFYFCNQCMCAVNIGFYFLSFVHVNGHGIKPNK